MTPGSAYVVIPLSSRVLPAYPRDLFFFAGNLAFFLVILFFLLELLDPFLPLPFQFDDLIPQLILLLVHRRF